MYVHVLQSITVLLQLHKPQGRLSSPRHTACSWRVGLLPRGSSVHSALPTLNPQQTWRLCCAMLLGWLQPSCIPVRTPTPHLRGGRLDPPGSWGSCPSFCPQQHQAFGSWPVTARYVLVSVKTEIPRSPKQTPSGLTPTGASEGIYQALLGRHSGYQETDHWDFTEALGRLSGSVNKCPQSACLCGRISSKGCLHANLLSPSPRLSGLLPTK